jgi:hypothetical protein
MTIEEYEKMDDLHKEEAVWDHGVFLNNYSEGKNICDAYELYDFFVAFCYNLDTHERVKITAKKHPDQLPYLFKLGNLFD